MRDALAVVLYAAFAAGAGERPAPIPASRGAQLVREAQQEGPLVLAPGAAAVAPRESALAAGIARAGKRGWIEEGVEASRQMLLECQRETSVVLTQPVMRAESQQQHCYRF